jgi:hypothetical protein
LSSFTLLVDYWERGLKPLTVARHKSGKGLWLTETETTKEKVKGEITDEHEMGRETEIDIQRIGGSGGGECFRVLGGN